jgi:hypothetical protein
VDHWPSPIVVGDPASPSGSAAAGKVIMRNLSIGGKNCGLVAYDTATGKKIWERGGFAGGGHGVYFTPLQVRVSQPGGGTQSLINWCEQILDAADGSVLATGLADPFGKKLNETEGQVGRDGHWCTGGAECMPLPSGLAGREGHG